MRRRSRWGPIIVFGGVCALAALAVILRFAVSPGLPAGAILVPRDVPTLRDAIAVAPEGGTIVLQVEPKRLPDSIQIDTPDLTLMGERGGALIEGAGSGPAITIRADGVAIKNLEFRSNGIGLLVEGAGCTAESLVIHSTPIGIQLSGARRCLLREIDIDGGAVGVELVASNGNQLERINVRDVSDIGVKLLRSADNVISDVAVLRTQEGISLDQASLRNVLIDCEIVACSEIGVAIRTSNGNRLEDCVVSDSGVGILLDTVVENTIRRCAVERAAAGGVVLQQAAQNRVSENRIVGSDESGIVLRQSGENAVSFNTVLLCANAGLELESSHRNLITGNGLEGNAVGVSLLRSNSNRLLRNVIETSDRIGVSVAGGRENRILDNEIQDVAIGMVLDGAEESVLLRNQIERASIGGIALLGDGRGNRLDDNEILGVGFGILVAGGERELVLGNRIARNDIGLLLIRPGVGIWIEGNRLEANGVGLAFVEAGEDQQRALREEGIDLVTPVGDPIAPVIAGNTFAGNREFDVTNRTEVPLYAAGNWWGDRERAATAGEVLLERSAWKGTVAVGTQSGGACVILGRILQFALETAGFKVIDLVGIGDGERVAEALRARDVDVIWWGTDTILEGIGVRAVATLVSEGWVAVAPNVLAERLTAPTLSALAELVRGTGETIRFAAPSSFGMEGFSSFVAACALEGSVGGITWTRDLSEAEAMVKFGAADVVLVDGLEETLTLAGFSRLADDMDALDSSPLAVVLQDALIERHPEIDAILSDIDALLTTEILHDLNSRVRLLNQDPEDVVREFLSADSIDDE